MLEPTHSPDDLAARLLKATAESIRADRLRHYERNVVERICERFRWPERRDWPLERICAEADWPQLRVWVPSRKIEVLRFTPKAFPKSPAVKRFVKLLKESGGSACGLIFPMRGMHYAMLHNLGNAPYGPWGCVCRIAQLSTTIVLDELSSVLDSF